MSSPGQNYDPTKVREWLVRTRAGDILGPYNQVQLLDSLAQGKFTIDDEIAPSQGAWVSAQVLSFRESDELTKTSTRTHQTSTTLEAVFVSGAEPAHPNSGALPQPPAGTRTAHSKRFPQISSSTYLLLALVLVVAAAATLKVRRESRGVQKGSDSGIVLTESPFLKNIYRKIQTGKTQEALRELARYHDQGPSKNDIEYLIPYSALLITETDGQERARKLLQQVLDSASTPELKARAHLWLGYAMLSADDGDLGESHFLEALQLDPKDPAARFNLGRAYLKQSKYTQALDYLNLAEMAVPNLWLVHLYKGRAKAALSQIEDAKVHYKTAIASSPDRWLSYIYFALFLKEANQRELAQDTLKIMLRRDPMYELHSPAPWGYFQEKVDYSEYLDAFNHVLGDAIGPDRELGRLYIQYLMSAKESGKRLEALWDKADLFGRVLALKVMLDRQAGPSELKRVLTKLPSNLSDFGYYAFVLRGEASLRLGFTREAHQDLERALDLSPRSAVALWAYASLLKRENHNTEAEQKIQTLLSYHPNYIPGIVWTQKD